MSSTSFQILCTGDVHLGRRPSRVPVEDDELSVRHVWDRFVETALNREVDVVALTGDIVDSENEMYEAFGALERGVQRLLDGGIEIVAVAGNHDYSAFPRLVRALDADGLHLLGRGGAWDTVEVAPRSGAGPVRFVGWSFPQATVLSSPLDDLDLAAADAPTIGVLHCEVGSGEGPYAPVRRDALARAPVDAWLLGHIHAPDDHRHAGQLQLYPGSLQPLDPGEPGTHGAWLVTVSSQETTAESVPLASLRYEAAAVDVSDCETGADVETQVFRTLHNRASELGDRFPDLRHVAHRLRIEGRTALHREIQETLRDMVGTVRREVDQVVATLEDATLDTRPDHDLAELARADDPPGVLAQLLLKLDDGAGDDDRIRRVLRDAAKATTEVHESSRYEPLRRDSDTREPPDRDALRSMLYQQGLLLLDELSARRD
ncbi:MAG: exonuclease SbcCD subunit D [Salinivenus sp.]